jgi:tetratricopeptide (TPR) repeat protein
VKKERHFSTWCSQAIASVRKWERVAGALHKTRIEIITQVHDATSLPWEFIRDRKTGRWLVLAAKAFSHRTERESSVILEERDVPLRILLVISRPGLERDVPFQSVARQVVQGLGMERTTGDVIELTVLRPSTFKAFCTVLHSARAQGTPYHLIHFDGHGVYRNITDADMLASGQRSGLRGYLVFENEDNFSNTLYVDGTSVGEVLADSDVRLLVLNACRSAHVGVAYPSTDNESQGGDEDENIGTYTSLAYEVLTVARVDIIAMQYNIRVATAAQFAMTFYQSLRGGSSAGDAASLARWTIAKHSKEKKGMPAIQEWLVPVVFEDQPLRLIGQQSTKPHPHDQYLKIKGTAQYGFVGRDGTLLEMDRTFNRSNVILLEANAGAGKTSAAKEFANWYLLSQAVKGVCFTSFEKHRTLAQILGDFGKDFSEEFRKREIEWINLETTTERRAAALEFIRQSRVLWIWDNVEPVIGLPGAESEWSADERRELYQFLQDLDAAGAKVLITSRRGGEAWLQDLPHKILMKGMRDEEAAELVNIIMQRYGIMDLPDLRPLLNFVQGNPLALIVTTVSTIKGRHTTSEKLKTFIEKLRLGEAGLDDNPEEGRSRSLTVSLQYGFESAFTEPELKIISLLCLFQSSVSCRMLTEMGNPHREWCLRCISGITDRDCLAILNRASELGIAVALSNGVFQLHPAMPWHLRRLFEKYYPRSSDNPVLVTELKAVQSFVAVMADLGEEAKHHYLRGDRAVVESLALYEMNLLHAYRVAIRQEWWSLVVSTMQGIQMLYQHKARWNDWRSLLRQAIPYFIEPATNEAIPGKEKEWFRVTEYRIVLAYEDERFDIAEPLARLMVTHSKQKTGTALLKLRHEWTVDEAQDISDLDTALDLLGLSLRELKNSECVEIFKQGFELSLKRGDVSGCWVSAFNLGIAFQDVVQNYDEAERWYRESLRRRRPEDKLGQSRCLNQLSIIEYRRVVDSAQNGENEGIQREHLEKSKAYCEEAYALCPKDAPAEMAAILHQSGMIHATRGEFDIAMKRWHASIKLEQEYRDNKYRAGMTRQEIAKVLLYGGKLEEAHEWASVALKDFSSYGGGRAQAKVQETEQLLLTIGRSR